MFVFNIKKKISHFEPFIKKMNNKNFSTRRHQIFQYMSMTHQCLDCGKKMGVVVVVDAIGGPIKLAHMLV